MTEIILKNAIIDGYSGGTDRMFSITIKCRQKDINGMIQEADNLTVEIYNSKDVAHGNK